MAFRALRAVVVVWGCELVLARISSDPQVPRDMLASAAGLALMGFAPCLLIPRTPLPPRWRGLLLALASVSPVVLVGLGIVGPPAWHAGRPALVALCAALALLAGERARRGWRGADPIPSPALLLGLVTAAAVTGWLLQRAEFPPLSITLPGLGLGLALTLLARARPTLPLAALLAVVVGLWPLSPPEVVWTASSPAPSGPDLVLLSSDTLRGDAGERLESYRRLAARGVAFSHAQAAAPWTLPSMGALITGLPPGQNGAGRWSGLGDYAGIHESRATLAARLAAAGYDTAAVLAPNGMIHRRFGFDRGFAVFDHILELGRYSLPKGIDRSGVARPTMARALMVVRLGGRRPTGDADTLVSRAIHVLEQRRERPLFLWIHFLDSHLPYRHASETSLPWFRRMSLSAGPGKREIIADPFWSSEPGRRAIWTAYDHENQLMDRAILRLLDHFDAHPERERVIVLTSDHGEEFFEHGDFEHGHVLYQELVHVPLVIAGPGFPAGRVEERVVGHVDVAPTLLAAAGLSDPSLPGQDLAGEVSRTPYLSENMLLYGPSEDRWAVRLGRWKAIFGPDDEVELYDLREDPEERRDLAAARPEVVRELSQHRPRIDPSRIAPAGLDDETKDALRALGYATGPS